MKKPLNFPNAKDTDDFKDIYNPNKGPNPGAYSQKKSDPKVVPVEPVKPVVADKKAEHNFHFIMGMIKHQNL